VEERVGRVSGIARALSEAAERLRPPKLAPPPERTDLEAEYERRVTDPDLRAATRSRFESGHYADAVEAGIKHLVNLVHERVGKPPDLDGTGLMTAVFSVKDPLLRVNLMKSKTEVSEQLGYMYLFAGVVGAWRNPRAHKLLDDTPESALMMLEVTEHLIDVARTATRTRKSKKKTP
jgi:uncharacterized protein (TIGR02391 family)